ncbi:alpha/beta hydrolase [Fibrobacter sp. UWB5]|uniref:poly(ethylene terephthalate) hydrolase family protein n=1 Tax=Fibrobacter sp. UWB5 TaxID=1964360 RepID=UPI001E372604|nr:alpha/beta hydrolase [Fibrobacter sp. UWB5]
MKSKYFKNLAKGLVVAGAAFALVNCGDAADQVNNAVAEAQQQYQDQQQGGGLATDPATNPSQTVTDPAQQGTVTPVDPADPNATPTDPNQGVTDPTLPADSTQTAQPADTTAQVIPPEELCLSSSLPDACGPGTNPLPTSSATVDPVASSASAEPAQSSSSEAVKPASSSSEAVKPASSSSSEQVVSSSSAAPKGVFLASGKEEEKDQLQVEYKTDTGWDRGGILAYPKQLSNDQKHAVVVWGPGGGTKPGAYEGMIRRLASHGFVVIALKESPGDASQAIKAIDWMDRQNKDSNSPLYNKLDLNTVGCSGHSMGGLESEQAVIKDKRVLTAFLNNSGDWNGNGANKVPTDRSIAILYGEVGMEKDNAKNDYNNQGVRAPACLIEMNGGPRNSEGGYGHGSGSWDGMAATVAWMRWHLGGETERKADFVGSTGKYIDGSIIGKQGHWKTQCKNF